MSVAMVAIGGESLGGLLDKASALILLVPFLYSTVKWNCRYTVTGCSYNACLLQQKDSKSTP